LFLSLPFGVKGYTYGAKDVLRLFEFKNFGDFQCRLLNTSSGMYLGSGKGQDQGANE
jgi:hypothetical protein